MKRIFFALFAVALVSGCETRFQKEVSAASSETTIDLAEGNYTGKFRDGCGKLSLGAKNKYTWDKACNGSIEFKADDFSINGRVMRIGAAVFLINEASADEINGIWQFRGDPFPMSFKRDG